MARPFLLWCVVVLLAAGCAGPAGPARYPADGADAPADDSTYDRATVLGEAEALFGKGAEGVAQLVERAFADLGRPNGFIKGEEAAGAFAFGLRYGHGVLTLKSGESRPVYWQGSSIGFDVGANASKTFVLVYNLPSAERVFQRYPGVDGSLYFVGGLGLNYHQSGDIVLVPMRLGVGWRQGANVGYLKLTPEASVVPF